MKNPPPFPINSIKKLNLNELQLLARVVKETSNLITITNTKQEIIWTNKTFQKVSGYSLNETLNKTPGQLLGGPDKDPIETQRMKDAIKAGASIEGEILNYGKNGKKFWVHYNLHPVKDSNGTITRYFSVQSDITEKKELHDQLNRQKIERQKAITRATLRGQEKERNELGQELHDNINQILVAAKLALGCSISSPQNNSEVLQDAFEYVNIAINEIRNFSHRLASPCFLQINLETALKNILSSLDLQKMCSMNVDPSCDKLLSDDIKLTIFRISQEQLSNIAKYSKADSLRINLLMKNKAVYLQIEDNGIGFDNKVKGKGIGISNIFNRVESYNGTVKLSSSPGHGCNLQLTIPIVVV